MLAKRAPQALLINGESGAGKTEASKQALRCLAAMSSAPRAAQSARLLLLGVARQSHGELRLTSAEAAHAMASAWVLPRLAHPPLTHFTLRFDLLMGGGSLSPTPADGMSVVYAPPTRAPFGELGPPPGGGAGLVVRLRTLRRLRVEILVDGAELLAARALAQRGARHRRRERIGRRRVGLLPHDLPHERRQLAAEHPRRAGRGAAAARREGRGVDAEEGEEFRGWRCARLLGDDRQVLVEPVDALLLHGVGRVPDARDGEGDEVERFGYCRVEVLERREALLDRRGAARRGVGLLV